MTKYVIINENETDRWISCEGIYENYYEAVGAVYCKFMSCIEEHIEDDYVLSKKEEFCTLEADMGYGWYAELIYEKDDIKIVHNERWYLLEYEVKEND